MREVTNGESHFHPLQFADLWRHRQFLFQQFGMAFLIVYPPPVWAHTLLFLRLAGNDIKASLYFLLKWKEDLSVSNRTSFSVCFENGMFNTMKSLSPAPLSLQRAPDSSKGSFHGQVRMCRNEDKGKQEADLNAILVTTRTVLSANIASNWGKNCSNRPWAPQEAGLQGADRENAG